MVDWQTGSKKFWIRLIALVVTEVFLFTSVDLPFDSIKTAHASASPATEKLAPPLATWKFGLGSQSTSSAQIEGIKIITIDGPAAVGKSTAADLIARRLGYVHIEYGVLYRAVSLIAIERRIDIGDADAFVRVIDEANIEIRIIDGDSRLYLDNKDITDELYTRADVIKAGPQVAKIPQVRKRLISIMRNTVGNLVDSGRGVVIAGRVAGKEVFPEADLKIYLEASQEVRVQRGTGQPQRTEAAAPKAGIAGRDEIDKEREESPMGPAEDAIVIDTSDLSAELVVKEISAIISSRVTDTANEYLRIGEYEEAVSAYKKTFDLAPTEDPDLLLYLADILRKGRPHEQVVALQALGHYLGYKVPQSETLKAGHREIYKYISEQARLQKSSFAEICWAIIEPDDITTLASELTTVKRERAPPVNMMLVALTSPRYPVIYEPLGLELLAGEINRTYGYKERVSLSFLDMNIDGDTQAIIQNIKKNKPDIVGLSIRLGSFHILDEILSRIFSDEIPASERPLVILGNSIPTYAAAKILEKYKEVIVVVGRGETAVKGIIDNFERSKSRKALKEALLEVPNLAFIYEDDNPPVFTQRPPSELEKIGIADRINTLRLLPQGMVFATMEASQGCDMRCTFCERDVFCVHTGWRGFPVKRVVDELEDLANLGITDINFIDEDFIGSDLNHARQIAEEIIKRGIQINFIISTRVDAIYNPKVSDRENEERKEVFRLLRKAGLKRVFLGVESGSPGQLKRYSKRLVVDTTEKVLGLFNELKIDCEPGFILFDPLMSLEELLEDIEFIERTNLIETGSRLFGRLRAQEGTAYLEILRKRGLLTGEYDIDTVSYGYRFVNKKVEDIANQFEAYEEGAYKLIFAIQGMLRAASLDKAKRLPGEQELEKYLIRFRKLDLAFLKRLVELVRQDKASLISGLVSEFELARLDLANELLDRIDRGEISDTFGKLRPEIIALEETSKNKNGKSKPPSLHSLGQAREETFSLTPVSSTIKTIPTGPEEVFYEAGSIEDVIARLKRDNRTDEAKNLRDVVEIAFKVYSELIGKPFKVMIVRNHIYNIAEYRPDVNILMIDKLILSNFELLRQELVSEEFRHMLYWLLLQGVEGRTPTPREEFVEEFATDMQKFEDILRIQTPEGRAHLLEPLIRSTDKYNFYRLLVQAIPEGKERNEVLEILSKKGLISDPEKSFLQPLPSFGRNRKEQLSALNKHYRDNPVVRIELQGLITQPVTIKEIDRYLSQFDSLRREYSRISKVPYIYLVDISIDPGDLFRDTIDEPLFSKDKQEVILTNTHNKKQLKIRRVKRDDGMYLKIGQRTYRVDPSRRISLSALFLHQDPLLWIGNYDLIGFSDKAIKEILDASRPIRAPTTVNPGVAVYLYDYLKDPISRTSEPELVSYSPSQQALSYAREILKTPYTKDDKTALYERLNSIAILAQSNYTIEGISYQQAIEDRIFVTDELAGIIKTVEDGEIEEIAREILFSISLLAIREKPEKEIAPTISLSEDERLKLENKIPFEITSAEASKEEFERLKGIFAAAVSEGKLNPYFIINIKNFTPNTFLAYSEFLRDISRRYNGNITFLLSIEAQFADIPQEEEPYTPFANDMAGIYVSRRRVIDTIGEGFYLKGYIANITDGGQKTRAANAGVCYEHWSKVLTADGISFLESNILTSGCMWLLLPRHGEGVRLCLASDGDIQFGKINLAGKPLSLLPDDFQIAACGLDAPVMTKEQRDKLLRLFQRYGYWTDGLRKSQEFQSLWAQIQTNIARRKLEQRGIFVTDGAGRMQRFVEKESPEVITEMASGNPAADGSGQVIENIFFIMERADVSYRLVTELSKMPTKDKDRFIDRKPVSVFKTIFQGFLSGEDTPVNAVLHRYIDKIYGISYGEGARVGDIADLEQHFLMWEEYLKTYQGPREYNITISSDVTLRYRGDRNKLHYLLRDVEIKGTGTLEIGEGVLIQGGSIEVQGNLVIPDRTKIIDSNLKSGRYTFNGEAAVVMGLDFEPGKVSEIDSPEPVETLDIYGDETLAQIDYQDGSSYLGRMINSLPYKGATIASIIGGQANWDRIRARMHITEPNFEKAIDMPLSSICRNDEEWFELAQLVFNEDISDEVLHRIKDNIKEVLVSGVEFQTKTEAIADFIGAIPSARLIKTDRGQLLADAHFILDLVMNEGSSEEELLHRIRTAYRRRFNAQIQEALEKGEAGYDEVKNLSYGEALYRVLAAMHPRLLNVKGVSTWDIARDLDFISLAHYGALRTAKQAKSDISTLRMQERILRAR